MTTDIEREFIIENIRLLSAKGYTQRSIASTLHISLGKVNGIIQELRQQAKHNITKYIENELPLEYDRTLTGLNQILTQAWQQAEQAESAKDRFMNLTLAKECYAMKVELLSSASVVDRAIKFVEKCRQIAQQDKSSDVLISGHREEQPEAEDTNDISTT